MLASLTWRLGRDSETPDDRTLVVFDEAAMTADALLLRLLHHAASAPRTEGGIGGAAFRSWVATGL
jgi:hypothetical protein